MKILIVDDDQEKSAQIISAVESMLDSKDGLSVTIANTLSNAIRVLGEVSFDLVILDLMLPYLL
ncbi:response regulator, partial [Bradyrhizobium sp. STM 3809]|uniref:response regulator n=1 Tax=Bradyrhizobium sp. STM 3809 TaxID=551936 RepID=UPI00054DBA33